AGKGARWPAAEQRTEDIAVNRVVERAGGSPEPEARRARRIQSRADQVARMLHADENGLARERRRGRVTVEHFVEPPPAGGVSPALAVRDRDDEAGPLPAPRARPASPVRHSQALPQREGQRRAVGPPAPPPHPAPPARH